MGKVKQLWQDKIDQVGEDYTNKLISFREALKKLHSLGLELDYSAGMLDSIKQLDLFEGKIK